MRDREAGAAMITVALAIALILSSIVVMLGMSQSNQTQAQNQRRDDTVVTGAEAMLERYSSKLTADPLYYMLFVDETEPPRICTDVNADPANIGQQVDPGDPWFDDCWEWDYAAAADYFEHPLLEGDPATDIDDVGVVVQVTPPDAATGNPLHLSVVGQQGEHRFSRAVEASIRPDAISEFAWLVETDLVFGRGVKVFGKIYTGNNLAFAIGNATNPTGEVYANIFAEGNISCAWTSCNSSYSDPVFMNGAQGWDSMGDGYNDILEPYPVALDFNRFLDDLDNLKSAACERGGICLDPAENPSIPGSVRAYLVEPLVISGEGKLRISYATTQPPGAGCLNDVEDWYVNSQAATWALLGTFDIPANGAVWANEHVVIGRNSATPTTLKGGATIYAGTDSDRKNVIIGSDVNYANGLTGGDVLGIAASDQVIINPNAVGADLKLNIHAAMLIQDGAIHVSRSCGASGDAWGSDGSVVLPYSGGQPAAELTTWGSIAMVNTGDVAAHFSPRNYGFDPRLESLRPPLFPLMSDEWQYEDWRETALPGWAP